MSPKSRVGVGLGVLQRFPRSACVRAKSQQLASDLKETKIGIVNWFAVLIQIHVFYAIHSLKLYSNQPSTILQQIVLHSLLILAKNGPRLGSYG